MKPKVEVTWAVYQSVLSVLRVFIDACCFYSHPKKAQLLIRIEPAVTHLDHQLNQIVSSDLLRILFCIGCTLREDLFYINYSNYQVITFYF